MKTALMMLTISALFLGGCTSTGMNGAFRSDGLPKQQYYVGGGFSINFTAPASGTAYIVEENSGKLLMTQTLDKDQLCGVDIDTREEDTHLRLKSIGIDPTNMKLGLYFVPAQVAGEVLEE